MLLTCFTYGSRYSRIDQVKFVEDSLYDPFQRIVLKIVKDLQHIYGFSSNDFTGGYKS